METPMNLLGRLNGIYSAKSGVPTNRRVAARRSTLDLFLCFLHALPQRSMGGALIPGHARRVSACIWGAFSVDRGH